MVRVGTIEQAPSDEPGGVFDPARSTMMCNDANIRRGNARIGMAGAQVVQLLGDIVATVAKGTEVVRWQQSDSAMALLRSGNAEAVLLKTRTNSGVLTRSKKDPGDTSADYVAPGATRSATTTAHDRTGAGCDSVIDSSDNSANPPLLSQIRTPDHRSHGRIFASITESASSTLSR